MEQEIACDSFVINLGTRHADYADHIVDIVRYTKDRILLAGIHNTMGKKYLLEKRIRKIISLKRDNSTLKKKNLRRILVVFSFCLLSMSLINPVIAGDNKSPIRKEASIDEIYGRWINKEYDEDCICIPAKMIINQDKPKDYIVSTGKTKSV